MRVWMHVLRRSEIDAHKAAAVHVENVLGAMGEESVDTLCSRLEAAERMLAEAQTRVLESAAELHQRGIALQQRECEVGET